MDALSSLLRGVRADGVLLSRLTPSPPWALRVESRSPLTLCSPLRGEGWLVLPGDTEPTQLRRGDTAVVRGPLDFSFVDTPESEDERWCTEVCRVDPPGLPISAPAQAPSEGSASLLVAEFPVDGEVGRRLLDVLPPVLVVPADPSCEDILDYIAAEIAADLLTEPGATVAGVARRVGYADPFGFSAAFKRTRGVSPSTFRRTASIAG